MKEDKIQNQEIKLDKNTPKLSELDALTVRRRKDGTRYISRKEMAEKYNNSILPYPIKVIKLDYCKNILYNHLKMGALASFPFSMVLSYVMNPNIRTKGFFSKSKYFYLVNYLLVYTSFVCIFSIDSILFSDYCNIKSQVYKIETDNDAYFKYMKTRIKNEINSEDVKLKKNKSIGLSDDEI